MNRIKFSVVIGLAAIVALVAYCWHQFSDMESVLESPLIDP